MWTRFADIATIQLELVQSSMSCFQKRYLLMRPMTPALLYSDLSREGNGLPEATSPIRPLLH